MSIRVRSGRSSSCAQALPRSSMRPRPRRSPRVPRARGQRQESRVVIHYQAPQGPHPCSMSALIAADIAASWNLCVAGRMDGPGLAPRRTCLHRGGWRRRWACTCAHPASFTRSSTRRSSLNPSECAQVSHAATRPPRSRPGRSCSRGLAPPPRAGRGLRRCQRAPTVGATRRPQALAQARRRARDVAPMRRHEGRIGGCQQLAWRSLSLLRGALGDGEGQCFEGAAVGVEVAHAVRRI